MNLIDAHGRRISYLRLSVTDRCNFRCIYCMTEKMHFSPRNEIASLEECLRLARVFIGLGISKLRITGGEPLVRRNILWLIRQLGALEGLDLVMTTNASQLERFAQPLREAGVRRLNLSLDTLRPERFEAITRTGSLDRVLRGIRAAQAAGFRHTKLNTVMMRGVNDDEFVELIQFAREEALDISFIEEMPLGGARPRPPLDLEKTLGRLIEHFSLQACDEKSGGPARYWRIPGSTTRVGLIAPHSRHFCEHCNRVRLSARGELHLCLGQNQTLPLLPLLRAHPEDDTPLRQAIIASMRLKPSGHDFAALGGAQPLLRFMSETGG